jgi:hypothetical protein
MATDIFLSFSIFCLDRFERSSCMVLVVSAQRCSSVSTKSHRKRHSCSPHLPRSDQSGLASRQSMGDGDVPGGLSLFLPATIANRSWSAYLVCIRFAVSPPPPSIPLVFLRRDHGTSVGRGRRQRHRRSRTRYRPVEPVQRRGRP